ncbi:hypothetical protein [Legionella londiniensis]|uniref:Secreted endonuclease n=1 Tax=Legionella londiniensis TaxID=45068 RepID=A0A0W0VNE3_9GAMM|nr:hypothetical protein [Legionella londiniensis]KTD21571.1 secreted endonuclease [Legionella londiniensis]STX92752.1 secreted endonuclease [Legionella londiniensis]
MFKQVLLLTLSLWISACTADEVHYYSTNPKALQKALDKCPDESPRHISCKKLESIAQQLKEYAFELRTSPQAFGKKILNLQETIARQEQALLHNTNQPQLKAQLQKNKEELQIRLAVVKWLESPER